MSELLNINLKVIGLQEPLNLPIKRNDEAAYRRAVDSVNKAIKQYREKFQVTQWDKILAMVALNFAVKAEFSANNTDKQPLLDELKNIDRELENYLNSQSE